MLRVRRETGRRTTARSGGRALLSVWLGAMVAAGLGGCQLGGTGPKPNLTAACEPQPASYGPPMPCADPAATGAISSGTPDTGSAPGPGGSPPARPGSRDPGSRDLAIPPELRDVMPGPSMSLLAQAPDPGAARRPVQLKLSDSVAAALMTYPELRVNEARIREARAGVGVSESALYPSAELRIAAGGNFSGAYQGLVVPMQTVSSRSTDNRGDSGFILRQIVYDFGATRSDIERAQLLRDSEKMKLRDKAEEVAHKTTLTYLRMLEQRMLLAHVDETIASHENLLRVIVAHGREGQASSADVSRVTARLIDVRAIRSDISLQLLGAEDQFERLTQLRPGKLLPPPELKALLPRTPDDAIARVLANNPRLGALDMSNQSIRKELEVQRASVLPKVNLEIDAESKNYRNVSVGTSQAEGRAMLAMRYRLLDGGLNAAVSDQIAARLEGGDSSFIHERLQIVADVRQAYRAIESAQRKTKLVAEGVESSRRVRDLYTEQFGAGKRTIFELLDGQMAFYTARRSQIETSFEAVRARADVLKAMGDLTAELAGVHPKSP